MRAQSSRGQSSSGPRVFRAPSARVRKVADGPQFARAQSSRGSRVSRSQGGSELHEAKGRLNFMKPRGVPEFLSAKCSLSLTKPGRCSSFTKPRLGCLRCTQPRRTGGRREGTEFVKAPSAQCSECARAPSLRGPRIREGTEFARPQFVRAPSVQGLECASAPSFEWSTVREGPEFARAQSITKPGGGRASVSQGGA